MVHSDGPIVKVMVYECRPCSDWNRKAPGAVKLISKSLRARLRTLLLCVNRIKAGIPHDVIDLLLRVIVAGENDPSFRTQWSQQRVGDANDPEPQESESRMVVVDSSGKEVANGIRIEQENVWIHCQAPEFMSLYMTRCFTWKVVE